MRSVRRHGSFWRALACLALAALLLRALVPIGFMASANAETGAIEITMCTGSGHASIPVDLPRGQTPEPAGGAKPCPFALASPPVLPEAAQHNTSAAVYAFEFAQAAAGIPVPAIAWAPHAPPTGPPLLT